MAGEKSGKGWGMEWKASEAPVMGGGQRYGRPCCQELSSHFHPPQQHPHSHAQALMLLKRLQGQGGSQLLVIHWGITKEKRDGEAGLNGRLQGLRTQCFIIHETEGVNFSGEGEKNTKCRQSRQREGECQTMTAANTNSCQTLFLKLYIKSLHLPNNAMRWVLL